MEKQRCMLHRMRHTNHAERPHQHTQLQYWRRPGVEPGQQRVEPLYRHTECPLNNLARSAKHALNVLFFLIGERVLVWHGAVAECNQTDGHQFLAWFPSVQRLWVCPRSLGLGEPRVLSPSLQGWS